MNREGRGRAGGSTGGGAWVWAGLGWMSQGRSPSPSASDPPAPSPTERGHTGGAHRRRRKEGRGGGSGWGSSLPLSKPGVQALIHWAGGVFENRYVFFPPPSPVPPLSFPFPPPSHSCPSKRPSFPRPRNSLYAPPAFPGGCLGTGALYWGWGPSWVHSPGHIAIHPPLSSTPAYQSQPSFIWKTESNDGRGGSRIEVGSLAWLIRPLPRPGQAHKWGRSAETGSGGNGNGRPP